MMLMPSSALFHIILQPNFKQRIFTIFKESLKKQENKKLDLMMIIIYTANKLHGHILNKNKFPEIGEFCHSRTPIRIHIVVLPPSPCQN